MAFKYRRQRKTKERRCAIKNQVKNDIRTVLDYLWPDEKKDYQTNPSKKHVFIVLKRLAKNVGYLADRKDSEYVE